MKKSYTQYLVGALLIGLAAYEIFKNEVLDFLTYGVAGLAFIVMGLIKNKAFEKHHKVMNIVSWVLTILAGILLLTLFRNDP
ncbi:MAG: hypothetical protein AAGG59_02750 [Bacteroidota bacterium]